MRHVMRLIVGLGNPGREYEKTPHNLGFLAIDRIAETAGIQVRRQEAKSLVGRGEFAGHSVALAKPQTMMNNSGMAVRDLMEKLECDVAGLIVLYDDVALPWGMLRIRERGTAGSHNGMKSVINAIGSGEFNRVRMGVRPEHPIGDLASYVLCPMSRDKREIAEQMCGDAVEAVELILSEGIGKAMLKFNRRVAPPAEA